MDERVCCGHGAIAMRVRDAIRLVAAALEKIDGFELPGRQAELLLSHVVGCRKTQLPDSYDYDLSEQEEESVRRYLGSYPLKPVPLYLGYCEIYGVRLRVNSFTLLPGTETDRCVELALELAAALDARTALDLGAGCGVIGAVVATQVPECRVFATEINALAAEVARDNMRDNNLADRVSVFEGSWLKPLQGIVPLGSVDLIVCNPPYCSTAALEGLPLGFADFAPRLAIDGGADGLSGHRAIVAAACRYLRRGGCLLLQTDMNQADAVATYIRSTGKYRNTRLVRGSEDQPRFVTSEM
jgi:release factor glutamine methyltransferase